MTRSLKIGLVTALVLSLACPARPWALTVAEEEKLGRKMMVYLRRDFVQDPVLNEYLARIGRRLAEETPLISFRCTFNLAGTEELNAFAAPGGTIVMTRGLAERLKTVDEMASVLAHELAHVNYRHLADQFDKSSKIGMATLAGALAGIALGVLAGDPRLTAAATAGTIAAGTTAMLAYSREDEFEADTLGTRTLVQAGYDLEGAVDALDMIRSASSLSGSAQPAYLSTHPAIMDRIARIRGLRSPRLVDPDRAGAGDFPWFQARLRATNRPETFFQGKPGPENLYGLGLVQLRLGRHQEARKNLEAAYQAAPRALGTAVSYAEVLRLSGQAGAALPVLQEALSGSPNSPAPLFLTAQVLLDLGRTQEARRTLEELTSVEPDNPEYVNLLGLAYGRAGQVIKAHVLMGRAASLVGDRGKALRNFDLALSQAKGAKERQEIIAERKRALELLDKS